MSYVIFLLRTYEIKYNGFLTFVMTNSKSSCTDSLFLSFFEFQKCCTFELTEGSFVSLLASIKNGNFQKLKFRKGEF